METIIMTEDIQNEVMCLSPMRDGTTVDFTPPIYKRSYDRAYQKAYDTAYNEAFEQYKLSDEYKELLEDWDGEGEFKGNFEFKASPIEYPDFPIFKIKQMNNKLYLEFKALQAREEHSQKEELKQFVAKGKVTNRKFNKNEFINLNKEYASLLNECIVDIVGVKYTDGSPATYDGKVETLSELIIEPILTEVLHEVLRLTGIYEGVSEDE